MKNRLHSRRFKTVLSRVTCVGTSLAFAFQPVLVFALPVGGQVTGGEATIISGANQTTINQGTNKAVIDWNGFNIGNGETVQFQQPGAGSVALNRIHDANATTIDGALSANGHVWLLNSNGVLFGNSAQVNVGGILATTSNVSNSDFLAGQNNFTPGSNPNGAIVNNGSISVSNGGIAAFVAPNVTNNGVISAKYGKVELGAGDTYTLDLYGDGLINLKASGDIKSQLVANHGAIVADGGRVLLETSQAAQMVNSLVNTDGLIEADGLESQGGTIILSSSKGLVTGGTISANGTTGGTIAMDAPDQLNYGTIRANGTTGAGGSVAVNASDHILQTQGSQISANGVTSGGTVTVNAGSDGSLFTSGTVSANGATETGGTANLLGKNVTLAAANINATGDQGGGKIHVGGGFQGGEGLPQAETVSVNQTTTLNANAGTKGDGGEVAVWSKDKTQFFGTATAHGGTTAGNGGTVEVSGSHLAFGGVVDASAAHGKAGTLLLDPQNLTIDDTVLNTASYQELLSPNTASGDYGQTVVALSGGNIVVTDPNATVTGVAGAGAAYVFNPNTGALVSALTGSSASDNIGSDKAVAVGNGNFVVLSSLWNNNRGAVTWGNGNTGVSGVVSSTNSLVGSTSGDFVGGGNGVSTINVLSNGNYVINSPLWNLNTGAVTWGSGSSGISGTVSSTNSLVGSAANDFVGVSGIKELTNGNYVIESPFWNSSTGAVTWGSGTSGVTGTVSAGNSLIGSSANDSIGSIDVVALGNGNYVVASPGWNSNTGAVTWGNGSTGVKGVVSAANSLVGSTVGDDVGIGGVVALKGNNNYVVLSGSWNDSQGAVTWGNGSTGVKGAVTSSNSLVGSISGVNGDSVGSNGVTALSNGNYVVESPLWSGTLGAATWGNGATGLTGTVNATNSLVGSVSGDSVGSGTLTALTNGNYVVSSSGWSGGLGAVTWGNGTAGATGTVDATNSLVGSATTDGVGSGGVTALTNGNYVVSSSTWGSNKGAATWGNGSTGVTGAISAANSLVGTTANDYISAGGITALNNGNYVVTSSDWSNSMGAVTWGNGSTGITGAISAANSLVGTTANDFVGIGGVTALSNGNYVVASSNWNGHRGAATWGSGTTGVSGAISAANSLIGTATTDSISSGGITQLTNGNYVVTSSNWGGNLGAVTWGSGTAGVSGTVSAANSLVGSTAGDQVGSNGVKALSNGDYVAQSSTWNGAAGAVTRGSGTTGIVGTVGINNSLVGQAANDTLGATAVTDLGNGKFAVQSPDSGSNKLYVYEGISPTQLYTTQPGANLSISTASLTNVLNNGTNLTLQANNDITLNSNLIVNNPSGNGGALTLQAGRSILLNANITTDNGNLTLIGNDLLSNGVQDANRLSGNATITMAGGTFIQAGTGNVTMELRDGTGKTNRGAGDISLRNVSANSITALNSNATGDIVLNGTLTAAGTGNAVVLSSKRNLINNGTSSAIATPSGRWIIYSSQHTDDTTGGLTQAQTINGQTYGTLAPGSITTPTYNGTSNTWVFSSNGVTGTITYTANNATMTYGGTVPTLTYTFTCSTGCTQADAEASGNPSLSTTGTSSSNAGTYAISMGQGSLTFNSPYSGYTINFIDGLLTIGKAVLTVVADAKSSTYGSALPTLTRTVTGMMNGDTSAVLTGGTLSTSATSSSNAGTYSIVASGGTATNYTINNVNGTLTIDKAPLTITANGKTMTYGGTVPTFTDTYTGLVNGDTASAVSGLINTSAGNSSANAGTYAITPGSGTSANYTLSYVDGTLTINKAPLTITANGKTMTYGGTVPTFTDTYTGLVNGDTASAVSGLTNTSAGSSSANAGTYAITPGSGTSANYTLSYVDGTLTINKAALTITADGKTMTYGGTVPTFTDTYTGFVNGDTASVVSGLTNTSAGSSASANAGTYAITPGGGTASNYTITNVGGTLTINKAALTVTTDAQGKTYGQADPTFTGTVSGLTTYDTSQGISYAYAPQGYTAGVTGNAGTYTIGATATDPNSRLSNYTITQNLGIFTVAKKAVTATFNGILSKIYGDANPTLNSGNFTFTGLVNGDLGTLFNNIVANYGGIGANSPVSASGAAVSATIGATSNYTVSNTPSTTLAITPRALTISADNKTNTVNNSIPPLTATYTNLAAGDTAASISGVTLSTAATNTSPAGQYTINVSGGASPNYVITNISGILSIVDVVATNVATRIASTVNNFTSLTDSQPISPPNAKTAGALYVETALLSYMGLAADDSHGWWAGVVPSTHAPARAYASNALAQPSIAETATANASTLPARTALTEAPASSVAATAIIAAPLASSIPQAVTPPTAAQRTQYAKAVAATPPSKVVSNTATPATATPANPAPAVAPVAAPAPSAPTLSPTAMASNTIPTPAPTSVSAPAPVPALPEPLPIPSVTAATSDEPSEGFLDILLHKQAILYGSLGILSILGGWGLWRRFVRPSI